MSNQQVLAKKASSITLKVTIIFFLVLGLLIPLGNIKSLINERQKRQFDTANEVGQTWGSAQTVAGPILVVPYTKESTELEYIGYKGGSQIAKTKNRTHYAYFLPEKLDITSSVDTQTRQRGIFKTLLYQSDIQLSGHFKFPDLSQWQKNNENISWGSAYIAIGLSDVRSIKNNPTLKWNNSSLDLSPGNRVFRKGLEVALPRLEAENINQPLSFSYALKINGSGRLFFTPTASQTNVKMQSSWNSPIFKGEYLPENRTISDKGFDAIWQMSFLNRDYPQRWSSQDEKEVSSSDIEHSGFGVVFDYSVDTYQISERSLKYGFMFIVLTFTIFFLFEVMTQLRLHPIQYLFVGFTMCLFYVFLLSLSEHFAFGFSYFITASVITFLVSSYSYFILGAKSRALLMGSLQAGLYAYLYVLLQAEDYSLLMGSIGLLIIMATIMFVTRKIDWYAINQEKNKGETVGAGTDF